jgi:predicted component of type VI protein secretion system
MATVTFQVLEGVDKGRVFRELATPVTIGREEGNLLRLNDERVSRFHAKVQQDNSDIILTDLESTNGTRVNGNMVQIRRLRPGDRIGVGRSMLLFGSTDEINARISSMAANIKPMSGTLGGSFLFQGQATVQAQAAAVPLEPDLDFDLSLEGDVTVGPDGNLFMGQHPLPPMPQKMSPAQAARISEIFDFLHRALSRSTENIRANEEGTEVSLAFGDWQKVLAVQMLLARYLRAVIEPEALIE